MAPLASVALWLVLGYATLLLGWMPAICEESTSPQTYNTFDLDSSTVRFRAFYSLEDTALPTESKQFLQEWLVPQALEWFQQRFTIRKPVVGSVKLRRECQSSVRWGYAKVGEVVEESQSFEACLAYDSNQCGVATVPSSHYSSQTFCASDSPLDCQTTEHGDGVDGADVLIYVTHVSSPTCSLIPGAPSHAEFCKVDQKGRPVAANLNFCPGTFTTNASERSALLASTVRSVLHALVFDKRLIPDFVDAEGTGERWPDPLVESFGSGRKQVTLRTGAAMAAARSHFGCEELQGLEVENSNKFNNMLLLEERVFHGEAMSSGATRYREGLVFSELTYAVVKDTGWFELVPGSAHAAKTLTFGRLGGCLGATGICDPTTGAPPLHSGLCSSDNSELRSSPSIDQDQIDGLELTSCTFDFRQVGTCAAADDMDGCKIVEPGQISCSSSVDALQESSGVYHEMAKRGWTFGESGGCVSSTLSRRKLGDSSLMWQASGSECHEMKCQAVVESGQRLQGLFVKVQNGTLASWVRCPSGAALGLEEFGFLGPGALLCPDNAEACGVLGTCPNGCSGRGNCVDSKCECFDGYGGADCGQPSKCWKASDCGSNGICDAQTSLCIYLPPPSPPPPPPPPPVTRPPPPASPAGELRGKASVVGWLRGCRVFVDRDGDGAFDSASEPSSVTDTTGLYIIKHGPNYSPDDLHIHEDFDASKVAVLVEASEGCVDETTGLKLQSDLRGGVEDGRVSPSTDLSIHLRQLGKNATEAEESLLRVAGIANTNAGMIPDVVEILRSLGDQTTHTRASLQLALESQIETTVALAAAFLRQGSGNSSAAKMRKVALASLAGGVLAEEAEGGRRTLLYDHASSPQGGGAASLLFTQNSVLWVLRDAMDAANNTELVLSTAVADAIARLNAQVAKRSDDYLAVATLHRVANEYALAEVGSLVETRDLVLFTSQTSDESLEREASKTSVPYAAVAAAQGNAGEAEEGGGGGGGTSWIDDSENFEWLLIGAGSALGLALAFYSVRTFVVRRRKQRELRKIPEDAVAYYEEWRAMKEKVMRKVAGERVGAELEKAAKAKEEAEEGGNEEERKVALRSALQLAFSAASTKPPMPTTVWKSNKTKEAKDVWVEDL